MRVYRSIQTCEMCLKLYLKVQSTLRYPVHTYIDKERERATENSSEAALFEFG